MLIKFLLNEMSIGRSLLGVQWYPNVRIKQVDGCDILFFISWLGGMIVWSRLKRTHKNTYGVQED